MSNSTTNRYAGPLPNPTRPVAVGPERPDLRQRLQPVVGTRTPTPTPLPATTTTADALAKLELRTSGELAGGDFRHQWLVKQFLVQGLTCILGGPSKSLKTSILIDLALSVGGHATTAGRPCFLGRFETPERPLPVLFFCAESGLATIQETARRVAAARGVDLARSQVRWSTRVPRIDSGEDLKTLKRAVKGTGAGLVIIDPLYLCLGGDANIASLGDIGARLSDLAASCAEDGATLVLAHHARKHREAGRKHKAMELGELAYAGVAEFARQWILVSRRSDYQPRSGRHELWLNVGGSAGTSGLYSTDFVEGQLGDDFTGRTWEVTVDDGEEAMVQAEAAVQARKHARTEQQLDLDTLAVLNHLRQPGREAGDSNSSIATAQGIGRVRVAAAIDRLVADRKVVPTRVQKGKKSFDGFRLAEGAADRVAGEPAPGSEAEPPEPPVQPAAADKGPGIAAGKRAKSR